jgi:MFS family permease
MTTKTDPEPEITSQPTRLFVSTGVAAALNPLNSTMIAVAMPAIGASFAVSSGALMHWLVTGYLVATIVCQTPGGKMGDMWGYSLTLTLGRWLFVAGTAAAVLAPNMPPLVIGRLLMAAGGALLVPTTMALIRIHVSPTRRPSAFGRMSAVMATAAAIGPALGGVLIDTFGWQSVFLANLPILVVSWLLQRGIDLSGSQEGRSTGSMANFDWIGTLLLSAGLITGMIGLRVPGAMTALLLGSAVLFFVAFAAWERRVPEPVLDLGLFKRPRFAAASLIVATQNLAMYALIFHMPFLFSDLSDLPKSIVGLAMLALTAGMVVFATLGGRVAAQIGVRLTVALGGLSCMVGVALLANLEVWQSLAGVIAPLGLIGLGLGLSAGPNQAAAMNVVAHSESGMAAAALSTTRYFGGIAGIATLSALLPDTAAGEDAAGHLTAFWIYVASCGVSVLLAFALPGKDKSAAK